MSTRFQVRPGRARPGSRLYHEFFYFIFFIHSVKPLKPVLREVYHSCIVCIYSNLPFFDFFFFKVGLTACNIEKKKKKKKKKKQNKNNNYDNSKQ